MAGTISNTQNIAETTPLTRSGLREVATLFKHIWPYRFYFVGGLACLTFSSSAGLAFPYLAGRLIDAADHEAQGFASSVSVNTIAMILVLLLLGQATVSFLQLYLFAQVGERLLADLRHETYRRIIHLPMSFFASRRVGELSARISTDIYLIQETLTGFVIQFLRQVVLLVGGFALIMLTSVRLSLVMLPTLPMLVLVATVLGRRIRRIGRSVQDSLASANVVVEETLQGIATVKSFGNEDLESQRYQSGLRTFVHAAIRAAIFRGLFVAFTIASFFGSVVLVLWYGAHLVQDHLLTIGELAQFLLYSVFIGAATNSLAELYAQLQRTVGATQRVRELLSEPTEGTHENALITNESHPRRFAGNIAFENVLFSYPSRPEIDVLKSISLTAEAGQTIALVGSSGAGKSTIVSLLLRFYDPVSGSILIDGRDSRDYPLAALRSQMAVVPQDVVLFGGTIAENIRYGKPQATQAKVEEAARLAHAHEFIVGFPEGYLTLAGERGVKLSGGQRQRIAIARAILRDPAILLLDEATSALDSESERLVQEALDELMRGRTSIVIAHRLSTIRKADKIFVLEQGRVIEAGTHEELMAQADGIYRTLTELQFGSHDGGDLPSSPDQDGFSARSGSH